MTPLQRAAAYLKKVGPKAALVIVPLAMATVPAQASILFNYSSGIWNVSSPGLINPNSESISGVPLVGSLIQGMDLSGTKSFDWTNGGKIVVTGTWSGDGSGSTPFTTSTVEGFYDFSWESSQAIPVIWELTYNIDGVITSFSDQPPTSNSGSGTDSPVNINVPLGGTLSNWTVTLSLSWAAPDASTQSFSLDVPGPGGIGISPQNAPPVPEPSTALLAAPLLAGLMIVRQRRKR